MIGRPDFPPVGGDNLPDNRQTQPGAAFLPLGMDLPLVKSLKQVREVGGGKPRSLVDHLNHHPLLHLLGGDAHANGGTLGTIFNAIVQ
jgi:hypothetical protein